MSLPSGHYSIYGIDDAPIGLPQQPNVGNSSILPVVQGAEGDVPRTTWHIQQVGTAGRYIFFASVPSMNLSLLPIGVSNNKLYALLNTSVVGAGDSLIVQSQWVIEHVDSNPGQYIIKLADDLNRVWYEDSLFEPGGQITLKESQGNRHLNQWFRIEASRV